MKILFYANPNRGGGNDINIAELNKALQIMDVTFRGINIVGVTGDKFFNAVFNGNEISFIPLNQINNDMFDLIIILGNENFFDILNKLKLYIPNFHEENLITVNSILNPTFIIDKWRNFPYRIMKDTLVDVVFQKNPHELEIKIKNIREYIDIVKNNPAATSYSNIIHNMYSKLPGKIGYYPGYCACCKKEQFFSINYNIGGGIYPAWTEIAVCPECHCNSRMRHIVDRVLKSGIPFNEKIYINERVAPVYHALSRYFPNIVGSEYLGTDKICGKIYNGIMHEDAMNLSFADESFASVVSCDVFEHVADCRKGFKETLRVLKNGGKFIFTVPIFIEKSKTLIRASINEKSELIYHEKPVYHGNPIDPQGGSLAFYDYGWDILDILRECGFSDVNFIVYFSAEKAHFGRPFSMSIEAVK